VIPDPEKEYLFNTTQLIRLLSSTLLAKATEQGNYNGMEEDFVSLDQEGYISIAFNVKSSFKDDFHI
jgi:hypothetical protein